ncbi:NEDD8-activating enzyme E1 regulatory subunit AXR1-like protein, partial [Tanacetum coccineum]
AMDEEISRLKTTSVSLLSDLGSNGTEDLINEMCRYGAAELHAVAAYVGGVASQEIVKDLRITVVDGSKFENGDLGNNLMVSESSLGQPKAKCVCAFLQELNDTVEAKFIEEHPVTLIETNPITISKYLK